MKIRKMDMRIEKKRWMRSLAAAVVFAACLSAGHTCRTWAATTEELTVTGLTWDEDDGTARWDENEYARYYQVRLYRNDNSVTGTRTTKDHYYEFEENITRKGNYHFEVRAVGKGSEKGEWVSSYEWYVTSSEAEDLGGSYHDNDQDVYHGPGVVGGGPGVSGFGTSVSGPGVSASAGTGGFVSGPGVSSTSGNHWCLDNYGWWYQYANGTWPRACWQCIDGSWFCFDDSGYRRYGWIYWGNKWYYCGTDGALMADTTTPDGYYVGSDGAWVQ